VRPEGVDEKLTLILPVRPFRGAIVNVEFAEVPAVAVTLVGLGETEKSAT